MLQKKTWKMNISVVQSVIIRMYRYHPKKRGFPIEWMMGLFFLKSVERGKCFIEYIPAENAWIPVIAEGYMVINCLWVSGSFKGNGYSSDLLNQCIADSKLKGKIGLCILSSLKKKPFLADSKFLIHKGFSVCAESDNGIQLWYLPFDGGHSQASI
jgi:hypothetical protein